MTTTHFRKFFALVNSSQYRVKLQEKHTNNRNSLYRKSFPAAASIQSRVNLWEWENYRYLLSRKFFGVVTSSQFRAKPQEQHTIITAR